MLMNDSLVTCPLIINIILEFQDQPLIQAVFLAHVFARYVANTFTLAHVGVMQAWLCSLFGVWLKQAAKVDEC